MINKPLSIITLVLITILSGCALLSDPGEIRRYTLSSLEAQEKARTYRRHLVIETPMVYPPLDNARIALRTSSQTIDYYACAEWGDRLANLIQESIIYSVQNSGYFASVSRPGEGLNAEYTLKLDVRDFQIIYNENTEPKHAQVTYLAQIVRNGTRRVIARKLFETKIPIREERMELITAALNKAHLQSTRAILHWIINKII